MQKQMCEAEKFYVDLLRSQYFAKKNYKSLRDDFNQYFSRLDDLRHRLEIMFADMSFIVFDVGRGCVFVSQSQKSIYKIYVLYSDELVFDEQRLC